MEALANVHGEILPLSKVTVPALDRGFLFGDAVYEVLRIYQGRPWLEEEHFARLRHSLESIRIRGVDLERLRRRMQETITAGPFTEATAYLQITRGTAPSRSHPFPADTVPFELLYVQEFRDPYVEARERGASAITHPDIRWARCDIKSTNLLGNVLSIQAAKEAGCIEALLFLPDGTLTEGTHTSFFCIKDGRLLTPPKSNDILPGITRDLVLRLAESAGVSVLQQAVKKDDLGQISELFLTGTTSEVLPLVRVDGQVIGTGGPGPVTRRIQRAYAEEVQAFLAR